MSTLLPSAHAFPTLETEEEEVLVDTALVDVAVEELEDCSMEEELVVGDGEAVVLVVVSES